MAGVRGYDGAKGNKGDTGPKGEDGRVGPRGEKGEEGPQGQKGGVNSEINQLSCCPSLKMAEGRAQGECPSC